MTHCILLSNIIKYKKALRVVLLTDFLQLNLNKREGRSTREHFANFEI